jgi:hypothetical protein
VRAANEIRWRSVAIRRARGGPRCHSEIGQVDIGTGSGTARFCAESMNFSAIVDSRGGISWHCTLLSLCALMLAGAFCTAAAAQRIGTAELFSSWSGGVVANSAFTPGSDAVREHAPFLGTLRLAETEMITTPAVFSPPSILGRDPHLFPGVAISFFTDKGDLVPFTQDVIRYASNNQGLSYWDVIVQPGRVWSRPGDRGWSRAGFPFALVNSIEGETHNGLATFLYKDGRVSNLRFQIVQQTAPFYIKDDFVAAGLVSATFAARSD